MGRVVLIACTSVGRALIEAMCEDERLKQIELVGIVNLKPEAAVGKANYDSYVDLAGKYALNIYYCSNVNEAGCVDFLRSCEADIIIQSGWSQKFGPEVLGIPRIACIGEHPAPLARGRGAACVNWAIITGEKEWGDTFFRMEEKYDTGEIYAQERFSIETYDDVKTVYDKVAAAAVKSIRLHLVNWTNGILKGIKQDDSKATHYPRRRPSDGEFDFGQDALSIYNQIRGQAKPYPGAFFNMDFNGRRTKIYVWRASLADTSLEGGKRVICGDGKEIILLRVQPEGQPEAWAADCLMNTKLESMHLNRED